MAAEPSQIDLLHGILSELTGMVGQMKEDHQRVAEENRVLRALISETLDLGVILPTGHFRRMKKALKG